MLIDKSCLLVLVALAASSAPSLADEARVVASGRNHQIDFFASVNPDCSSPGLPTVRLVDGPSQGEITTDKGKDFMTFAGSNPRSACNKKRVSGVKMFYRSATGFMGIDHVRVLIISSSGTGREANYTIEVR